MSVLLQQRLKYALTRQESRKIANTREGNIRVDGKIRRNHRFPLGQMDVVSIEKTNEFFRILLDVKGRFNPHRIDAKEASFKLCKVVKKYIGKQKIPYVVTHDGRSFRFPHPDISKNDTLKVNLTNHEISSVIKYVNGATVYLTGGNNIGRIGILQSVEKHPGSFDITSRIPMETPSPPVLRTSSSSVMVRAQLSLFQREKVSSFLLSRRETPDLTMRMKVMMTKMRTEHNHRQSRQSLNRPLVQRGHETTLKQPFNNN